MISSLGFTRGRLLETIVTTYNSDGSPNAAPIGVTASGEVMLAMKVHTDTDTYVNLLRRNGCVVNLVYDPYLFIRCALTGHGRGGAEPEVDPEEVAGAGSVDAPYLEKAAAYIEAILLEHKEYLKRDRYRESEASVILCRVERVTVKGLPQGPNRGLNHAIELAIELTRGERDGVAHHMEVIRKAIPQEEYLRIEVLLTSLGYISSPGPSP